MLLYFKFYKSDYAPPLQYYRIVYLSKYLALLESYTFLYAFVLLSSILSFQLEGLPLAFLVRQV